MAQDPTRVGRPYIDVDECRDTPPPFARNNARVGVVVAAP